MIYYSEGYKANQKREASQGAASGGNETQASKGPLPEAMLNSPGSKLWQHMWNAIHPRNQLFRDSEPRVLLGASHRVPSWLAHIKIPYSPKESMCLHKPHCSHEGFRHSEPLPSIRVLGTLSKSKFPSAGEGPALQSGLSKGKPFQTCYYNSFLSQSVTLALVQIIFTAKLLSAGLYTAVWDQTVGLSYSPQRFSINLKLTWMSPSRAEVSW